MTHEDLGPRNSPHRLTSSTSSFLLYLGIAVPFIALSVGMIVAWARSHDVGLSVVTALLAAFSGLPAVLLVRQAGSIWRHRYELIHVHRHGLVFETPSAKVTRRWSTFAVAGITSVRKYGVEISRLLDVRFTDGTRRRLTGLSDENALIAVALFGAGFSALIFGVPAYLLAMRGRHGDAWGVAFTALSALFSVAYYGRRALSLFRHRNDLVHAHELGLVFERAPGRVDVLKWSDSTLCYLMTGRAASTRRNANHDLVDGSLCLRTASRLVRGWADTRWGRQDEEAIFFRVKLGACAQEGARHIQ